jgi:hypothetical protein
MRFLWHERGRRDVGEALVDAAEAHIKAAGAKNVLFAPFIYKSDHFTKTGSGQT